MGKRGPKPMDAATLARRGASRAGRRAAEEAGELVPAARHPFIVRESPPRAPLPESDELDAWLPLLLLLPKWDPRMQAAGCRFDATKARHAIDWFENHVHHLTGDKRGQLIRLDPWQRSFIGNLFGWIVAAGERAGRRRFRKALLYVAKKNSKRRCWLASLRMRSRRSARVAR